MSKYSRTAAILLSLVLIFSLFSACNSEKEPAATPTPSASATSDPNPTPTPDDTTADGAFKLPIVDNPVTLSIWQTFQSSVVSSPAEVRSNMEIEKLTNVHIEYQTAPTVDAASSFNLMLASQDYADILFMRDGTSSTMYSGGHDRAIDDGVFLKLNDYVENWAPNYKAMLESNDTIYRQSVTDNGNMAVFATIQDGNEPAWCGPMIRQDFLDDVGMQMPQTYDELYNVLKAFKDKLNVEQPLSIGYLGYNTLTHPMTAGFGIDPTFYNENGTVKFGFIEEGFRDYLTTMNRWYSEGLIDRDFYTRGTDTFGNSENVVNDKIGALEHGIGSRISVFKASAADPDFRMVGMPIPRKNANDVAHFRRFNHIVGTTPAALTTTLGEDSARLETAVRWMDFRFNEQGYNILNYGVEGESFEYVDGKPQFTEMMYKNPDATFPDMTAKYVEGGAGSFYIWKRNWIAYSEDQINAFDVWGDSASGDWVMPPIAMSSEEGAEFSAIFGDITTYIDEMVTKFITGEAAMTEFDSFVEKIKGMNIERCIEIQQTALDRYNKR